MSEIHCNDCADWLHAYLDNEIGTEMALRVSQHLTRCQACKIRLAELQVLKGGIKENLPYYPAPELLQRRLLSQVKQRTLSQWIVPAFSAVALAASLMLYIATPSSRDVLMDEVVSSHVRSLMEQHLTDVASTDKHTVKPWFAGRIDFSPPVVDLADKGYPLIGGRLDYIRHQNAAALAYRRNKHIINLFILPDAAADSPIHTLSRRGFNIVLWHKNHMAFEAVSDLNTQELEAFAQLVNQP